MNLLAHAFRWLDKPYRMAGTVLPDLLAAIEPHHHFRRNAPPLPRRHEGGDGAELSRGIAIHHAEDRWFHDSVGFRSATASIAGLIDEAVASANGKPPRVWFVSHVLLELLLDEWLELHRPGLARAFRSSLAQVDVRRLALLMPYLGAPAPVELGAMFERVLHAPGPRDEGDDALLARLARVLARVGLPEPTAALRSRLPEVRAAVQQRGGGLLPPASCAREALQAG